VISQHYGKHIMTVIIIIADYQYDIPSIQWRLHICNTIGLSLFYYSLFIVIVIYLIIKANMTLIPCNCPHLTPLIPDFHSF